MSNQVVITEGSYTAAPREAYNTVRNTLRDGKYMFKVIGGELQLAKKGYLQVSLNVGALDENGGIMDRKFMNLALPGVFNGNAPSFNPTGILREALAAIGGVSAAGYDHKEKDAGSTKSTYTLEGEVVKYKDLEKKWADLASKFEAEVTAPGGAEEAISQLIGRTFYASVVTKGEYTNVQSPSHIQPEDVIFTRAEAFKA